MSGAVILTLGLSEITGSSLVEKLNPLRQESEDKVRLISCTMQRLPLALRENPTLVIINLPQLSNDRIPTIFRLQEMGYTGNILVFVSDMAYWMDLVHTTERLSHVKLMEWPYTENQLLGYVRRLIRENVDYYRSSPRYEIVQPAMLMARNQIMPCVLQNVSRGGVCLRMSHRGELIRNEFVSLEFKLGESVKTETIRGRVAWVDADGGTAGIEFVKRVAA